MRGGWQWSLRKASVDPAELWCWMAVRGTDLERGWAVVHLCRSGPGCGCPGEGGGLVRRLSLAKVRAAWRSRAHLQPEMSHLSHEQMLGLPGPHGDWCPASPKKSPLSICAQSLLSVVSFAYFQTTFAASTVCQALCSALEVRVRGEAV